MSTIGGIGGGAPLPDPAAAATTSTPAPTASAALAHAAFAGDPVLAEVLAGTRTVEVGAEGPHVALLEEALIGLGYGLQGGSRVDERMTRATQNALARFQRDQGLPSSGTLDAATLAALDRAAADAAGGAAAPTAAPATSPPADRLSRIGRALERAVQDGRLDADEVPSLFDAAGGRVNDEEMQEIRAAVLRLDQGSFPPYEVSAEAKAAAEALAQSSDLDAVEAAEVLSGTSFGGTEVPQAVRDLLANARLAGARAYDVNETRTTSSGESEGVWSPYPATTPAIGNMAFDYTEITPEKLKADMEDRTVTYKVMDGTEKATYVDDNGKEQEYERVRYRDGVGGTGNILATYDEAWHDDLYARGSSGQKWANNFAILADGSIHCLPAARRSELQDLILTNPHLSRGKHMLFNGHLDVRDGVVHGVEMSGRLSKMAAEGDEVFIDPIAVLEAWGFEIAPGVTLRYGNTSEGVPVQDPETGTIRAPDR